MCKANITMSRNTPTQNWVSFSLKFFVHYNFMTQFLKTDLSLARLKKYALNVLSKVWCDDFFLYIIHYTNPIFIEWLFLRKFWFLQIISFKVKLWARFSTAASCPRLQLHVPFSSLVGLGKQTKITHSSFLRLLSLFSILQ